MYDEKLGFATQFRPRTRFISNGGQRERILYQPMFDENGIMDLVEAGREDFYDFIQSHADSVDIHVLLARFQNGDVDALSRVQGAYGDFTNMPTSYAELLNRVNEGQSFFNSLPVDIRAKFNHNFAEFMAGMDKPDFLDKLGIKPEREPHQSQEEKPAVEPKKEVSE
jgi:hypothetical protein